MQRRREPSQARSRVLVESVVVGALHLLRTTAPGEITTRMLADAAGCSVAAMYRFFEDKDSIFDAAADRLQETLRARYEATLAKHNASADLETVVGALLVETASFVRREPAFRALRWANVARPSHLERAYKETNRFLADLLRKRFAPTTPGLTHVFLIAVEAGGHLVGVAFEHTPKGDPQVLRDARTMVGLYLDNALR